MISCSHFGMFHWAGFEGREVYPLKNGGWLVLPDTTYQRLNFGPELT